MQSDDLSEHKSTSQSCHAMAAVECSKHDTSHRFYFTIGLGDSSIEEMAACWLGLLTFDSSEAFEIHLSFVLGAGKFLIPRVE